MINLIDVANEPTGQLRYKVFKKGALIEEFDGPNLIVDGSKYVHAQLLGGAVTNQSVTKIGFGTSGTAPAAGNTALTNAYVKNIDSVSYPASNQVQFNFSLTSGEANGKAILEFGLLTTGNTLYSRRIRSAALAKDSDISLSGSWIITF